MTMESPKYLIIITLIDGQNFSVPEGILDKVEATVFAEARFGNESILKSDPIKLTNSNPEFVTELAWQLDKKSLHQLRVERRAIKLQVFMQTREKRKGQRQNNSDVDNECVSGDPATNKVELIGYTVLDIRSAQESGQPKLQWLPLLNPKFRKSSYNRPEVQLSVTLTRVDENEDNGNSSYVSGSPTPNNLDAKQGSDESKEWKSESLESEVDSSVDSRLYKTCLDFTLNSTNIEKDEILENDIKIISKDNIFFIFDSSDPDKSTIDDCSEHYKIIITIPFIDALDSLIIKHSEHYYFSVHLFGASSRSDHFTELTSNDPKEIILKVCTTQPSVLSTYFDLNSSLEIKLHQSSGRTLGLATIQLDQLCKLNSKRRSIEGIFALQSDHDIPSPVHPSIGVSVVLEKLDEDCNKQLEPAHDDVTKDLFEEDVDDYLFKTLNDTHQLTVDVSNYHKDAILAIPDINDRETIDKKEPVDHHFCFTIDLKNFLYASNQRLIPTLRELVVRYAYPFFGYKDTITTDASVPISPTNSIIVDGFCQFNFATTPNSLLLALKEIPLDLEILTCEHTKRIEFGDDQTERIVATSILNIADTMGLTEKSIDQLEKNQISATVSAPVHGLDGIEVGEIQIYLCLEDLGKPPIKPKISVDDGYPKKQSDLVVVEPAPPSMDTKKMDEFMVEIRKDIESWKTEYSQELNEEMKKRESECYKRLYHRFEAKDTKREHEYRKKMEELNGLEKKLKNSLIQVESLERKLSNNFEQLRTKDALLDTRLETLDLTISKAISDIRSEYERKPKSLPVRPQRSFEDNHTPPQKSTLAATRMHSRPNLETDNQTRRSSLRNNYSTPGIPLPVRSSSLVRGPSDGLSTRLVKRPTAMTTTVINGVSARPRSSSTRINLSKETQEKLASLRKEKAELLKRGCRPNDELIQEINSLIEKLVC